MFSLKYIWTLCLSGLACLIVLFIKLQWQTEIVINLNTNNNKYHKSPSLQLSDEKYLTFLPHSGLHNQRIALINALVLAKTLNRTLILPEINMGKANYWRESKQLERQLSDCPTKPRGSVVGGCYGYSKYVPTTVANIFDLSSLSSLGIRVTQRKDMGLDYFEKYYGATPSDIVYIRDQSRFSYRIYDSKENQMSMLNFEQRIDMEDLDARNEKIMVFGSLFSSFRLALEKPGWIWLWDYLFTEISFHHPTVIAQTLDIVGRLGGPGQFVSLHLRQGDGVFKAVMDQTIEQVRLKLSETDDQNNVELDVDTISAIQSIDDATSKLEKCLKINSSPLSPLTSNIHPKLRLIYMATDAPDPRRSLPHLFNEFPCLFSLSDFPDVMANTLSATALSPFVEDQQPSRFGPLFFPLIDAEIASYGSSFVGTKKSTFSKYISYRNRRFLAYYPNQKF
ncbi:unnamed protein product [Cunninghamella echinulata]